MGVKPGGGVPHCWAYNPMLEKKIQPMNQFAHGRTKVWGGGTSHEPLIRYPMSWEACVEDLAQQIVQNDSKQAKLKLDFLAKRLPRKFAAERTSPVRC